MSDDAKKKTELEADLDRITDEYVAGMKSGDRWEVEAALRQVADSVRDVTTASEREAGVDLPPNTPSISVTAGKPSGKPPIDAHVRLSQSEIAIAAAAAQQTFDGDAAAAVQALHGIIRIETPEGPMGVIAPVVQTLVAKGLLVSRADGNFHAPSKTELMKWVDEYGVCDFCSAPDPMHTILTPDFDMMHVQTLDDMVKRLGGATHKSTGGWAACDACYAAVRENRRADLLRRSIDGVGGGKYSAAAIKGLHQQFWQSYDAMTEAAGIGAVLQDLIEDRLPPSFKVHVSDRGRRIEAVRRLTGLTSDELEALGRGDVTYKQVTQKLSEWRKKFGSDYEGARQIVELLDVSPTRPLLPGQVPHWQQALDAKFAAMKEIQGALVVVSQSNKATVVFPDATDLNDSQAVADKIRQAQLATELNALGFAVDIKHLRAAEAYSFNAETMEAIRVAAAKIPHDSPLSSVDVPRTQAGWFWFAQPMPVTSSPIASDVTDALLWGWHAREGQEPTLRFSAYVKHEGKVQPSTKWEWPLSKTFHEMLALNQAEHHVLYGDGGVYSKKPNLVGAELTMKCIAELSLFFLMACVWFKQRIIVEAQGHVERHARKRMQKEHKLAEPPTVRVVALRKVLRPQTDAASGGDATPATDEHGRKLHVRFIVGADTGGFPRLQACGPERKDRKLIWVYPFPKGPADAPWKPRDAKVYAVVR